MCLHMYSLKREISSEIVPIAVMLMSIWVYIGVFVCVCIVYACVILLCTAGEIVHERVDGGEVKINRIVSVNTPVVGCACVCVCVSA